MITRFWFRSATALAGLGAASLALLLALSAVSARQDAPPPPAKRGTAARAYKNLKVLRDLPVEQFLPLMNEWNEALGVQCVFCHVEVKMDGKTFVDYEKEDNPKKEIAREMVLLTRELNEKQKSIQGKATCYMCHQGHAEPIYKKPPLPAKKKPTRPKT